MDLTKNNIILFSIVTLYLNFNKIDITKMMGSINLTIPFV